MGAGCLRVRPTAGVVGRGLLASVMEPLVVALAFRPRAGFFGEAAGLVTSTTSGTASCLRPRVVLATGDFTTAAFRPRGARTGDFATGMGDFGTDAFLDRVARLAGDFLMGEAAAFRDRAALGVAGAAASTAALRDLERFTGVEDGTTRGHSDTTAAALRPRLGFTTTGSGMLTTALRRPLALVIATGLPTAASGAGANSTMGDFAGVTTAVFRLRVALRAGDLP